MMCAFRAVLILFLCEKLRVNDKNNGMLANGSKMKKTEVSTKTKKDKSAIRHQKGKKNI